MNKGKVLELISTLGALKNEFESNLDSLLTQTENQGDENTSFAMDMRSAISKANNGDIEGAKEIIKKHEHKS